MINIIQTCPHHLIFNLPLRSQRETAFSTSVFTPGEVYATAFATATGFHYTLSVMENTTQCTKYHAKEVSPKNFIFEIVPRFRLLNVTESLCVAVKIGSLFLHLSKGDKADEVNEFCSTHRRNRSKQRRSQSPI